MRVILPSYQRSTLRNGIRIDFYRLAGTEHHSRYEASAGQGQDQAARGYATTVDFRCAYGRPQRHIQRRHRGRRLMPESKLNPRDQAAALAAALRDKNLEVFMLASRGHERHPCVHITNPLPVDIYAAPDEGTWYFWWPWMERIGPIDAVAEVAEVVSYVVNLNVGLRARFILKQLPLTNHQTST